MFIDIEIKAETQTAKTNESVVQEIAGNPFIFWAFSYATREIGWASCDKKCIEISLLEAPFTDEIKKTMNRKFPFRDCRQKGNKYFASDRSHE